MNYLKLPDKDKLRIIERKVYETHNIIKVVADALEFREYEQIEHYSDCMGFLRKAQQSLNYIGKFF